MVLTKRRGVLFSLLGITTLVWAFTAIDSRILQSKLSDNLDEKVAEFRGHSLALGRGIPDYEVAAVAAAGRVNGIYGKAIGKVTIYTRRELANGRSEYGGVEFFFEYEGGAWRESESIAFRDHVSLDRSRAVFAKASFAP